MTTPSTDRSAQELQLGPLMGKGFTSDIYGYGEERVVKLFHTWVPSGWALREFNVTQSIHRAGLSVPAAYEPIELNGRQGIVFEKVEGVSMLTKVQRRPWTLFRAVRELTDLQAKVHRSVCPDGLPSQRDRIEQRIEIAPDLSDGQRRFALGQLAKLPDGTALCHGDFHPENILFSRRGPIVIDWGSATRGDPFGDVACTSRLMQFAQLPPWAPFYAHWLLKCFRRLLHRAYLKRYLQLQSGTLKEVEAWAAPLAAAAKAWRMPEAIVQPTERSAAMK